MPYMFDLLFFGLASFSRSTGNKVVFAEGQNLAPKECGFPFEMAPSGKQSKSVIFFYPAPQIVGSPLFALGGPLRVPHTTFALGKQSHFVRCSFEFL